MQSELKSLSKIFSEVIFRIPDYQRGYAWQEKQLKDFWTDLEQLHPGKSHYTGVLTLEPVTLEQFSIWEDDKWIIESKKYTPLYVVDGQQRLTTAVILLQCILDTISDDQQLNFTDKKDILKKYISESKDRGISRSYIFGYEKDNPSYEFLKQSIFGCKSDNHSTPEETTYTKNLLNSHQFFTKKLSALNKEEVEKTYTKLTQNLLFNIFYIEEDLDVFITFETMNNRGKSLSHLELLKNRLIYLSTKFESEDIEKLKLRKAINESWKTIYHYLGKIKNSNHDDDRFLRTHFLSYFGPKLAEENLEEVYGMRYFINRQEPFKDHLLETVFTPKRFSSKDDKNSLSINEIYNYVSDIKHMVVNYYGVVEPDNFDWKPDVKTVLGQINRIEKEQIFLITIAVIHSYKKNHLVQVKQLKKIEILGFFISINSYYFNDLDLTSLAVDIFKDAKNLDAAFKKIQNYIDSFKESNELKEKIRNLGKDAGYYGWGAIRYFMYEYEMYLKSKSKTSRCLLHWEENKDEFYNVDYKTAEHIYPQRAHDQYWKDKFSTYSVQQRNKLRNSLGNLLPVSRGKNSSLSNHSFTVKKGDLEKQIGYRYGCLSEIQVANYDDWTAKEILSRSLMLTEFMEKRWEISLGTQIEKVQLLGLDFILEKENIDIDLINSAMSSKF